MKKTLMTILTGIAAVSAAFSLDAKVVLPHMFGDNMVLQQQTSANIWGIAEPNSTVTLTPSWDAAAAVSVQAGQDGKWIAAVTTPTAGGPYTMSISDGEELRLSNILIGEVWICSGQSNMEMPMRGFGNQPVEGATDIIIGAKASTPIRMCTVKKAAEFAPMDDFDAVWLENEPDAVARTSATAYCFAKYIQNVLDVPVGIIVTSWGGSTIEAWMDRETITSEFPEFDTSYIDSQEYPKDKHMVPSLLYNGMMHPLIPFTFRGMIWYQGEANRTRPDQYLKLQQSFMQMLRGQWGLGDFPFYYVQIAPYRYGDAKAAESGFLQEAQTRALDLIPNSGMAVTLDIGDFGCIHPAKKQIVGQRLALLALVQTYGFGGIDPYAPLYDSWQVKDGKILVEFKVGSSGLAPLGQVLEGFEVAGEDKVFHPAKAKIKGGKTLEVICHEVAKPAAVRYGFHNCTPASLYNNFGIPASPFRTDNW